MSVQITNPEQPASRRPDLSNRQASEYTGLTESQLDRLRWEHKIDYYRLGNVVRYSIEDLDAYVESCRIPARRSVDAQH